MWQKYFKNFNAATNRSPISGNSGAGSVTGAHHKFNSWLPEVYEGTTRRLERYQQYDQMDTDSEVNTALDIIAEFSTLKGSNGMPFAVNYYDTEPTVGEMVILQKALRNWIRINKWDTRLFELFRSTIKYGDQFFVRDPDTFQLFWINPADVTQIAFDKGSQKILAYYMKDVELNYRTLVGSDTKSQDFYKGGVQGPHNFTTVMGGHVPNQGSPVEAQLNSEEIEAHHVMHVSLTKGLDTIFPFGPSVLEPVFKVFKQKELLEDAILIYRIQRAPERKIFYVDTRDMNPVKARAFVEKTKNEIHQKMIPNRSGGTTNITDSTYNPQSIIEDYWFTTNSEGQGSRVEVLPGGSNLGEIDDLRHFTLKLIRGLRVPGSYLPTGPEDSTGVTVADGKMNQAFIQEHGFSKYCERLQNLIMPTLDEEFKKYIKFKSIGIEASQFKIELHEPMNFSRYRQIEMENAVLPNLTTALGVPEFSKRFAMEKYGGLTQEEIAKNERLLAEEKAKTFPELGIDDLGGAADAKLSSVMGAAAGGLGGDFGGDPGGEGDDADLGGDDDLGGDAEGGPDGIEGADVSGGGDL